MKQWFYEANGNKHGPVSESELIGLYPTGINERTLVWTESLGEQWVHLDKSGLKLFRRAEPPPLPISNITHQNLNVDDGNFLSSPLTVELIQKNEEIYLKKWEALLIRKQEHYPDALFIMSWNWSAFLLSSIWLFYRKFYIIGTIFVLLSIIITVLWPAFSAVFLIIGNTLCAMYADAVLLYKIRQKSRALLSKMGLDEALEKAKKSSATNLIIPSILIAIIVASKAFG